MDAKKLLEKVRAMYEAEIPNYQAIVKLIRDNKSSYPTLDLADEINTMLVQADGLPDGIIQVLLTRAISGPNSLLKAIDSIGLYLLEMEQFSKNSVVQTLIPPYYSKLSSTVLGGRRNQEQKDGRARLSSDIGLIEDLRILHEYFLISTLMESGKIDFA